MDKGINNQLFLVCGATSGFGHAVAMSLLSEGAGIIAVARDEHKLKEMEKSGRVETVAGDITMDATLPAIIKKIGTRQLHGALINAGGPPPKTAMEATPEDWDTGYRQVLRWKVGLAQQLVQLMKPYGYGRMVFIESASVKQPMENMVLSNALRLAVVGFVKTLSQEIASAGITVNVLAPGAHDTPAINRVYKKKAEQNDISEQQARDQGIAQIPVGALGQADNFASLALWLLAPQAVYITGQTISVDGGTIKGVFG